MQTKAVRPSQAQKHQSLGKYQKRYCPSPGILGRPDALARSVNTIELERKLHFDTSLENTAGGNRLIIKQSSVRTSVNLALSFTNLNFGFAPLH